MRLPCDAANRRWKRALLRAASGSSLGCRSGISTTSHDSLATSQCTCNREGSLVVRIKRSLPGDRSTICVCDDRCIGRIHHIEPRPHVPVRTHHDALSLPSRPAAFFFFRAFSCLDRGNASCGVHTYLSVDLRAHGHVFEQMQPVVDGLWGGHVALVALRQCGAAATVGARLAHALHRRQPRCTHTHTHTPQLHASCFIR